MQYFHLDIFFILEIFQADNRDIFVQNVNAFNLYLQIFDRIYLMASDATQRATITDVARLAGVSIATVSRVINSTAPVAGETSERVERAIQMLGFQPHPVARSLAGGKTHTLGILVPDLTNPFFSLLMRGIEQGVRNHGFDLLVHLTGSARSQNGRRVHPLGEHNTDGLLVFTNDIEDSEIRRLHKQGFPLVLLYRSAPTGIAVPTVTIDNATGTRQAIEHLILQCGRRKIAFIQGLPNNEDSYQRGLSFRQTLAANGLAFDPKITAHDDFNQVSCGPVIEQWLQEGREFDAIFADNDVLAVDVVQTLRKNGIKIPEQVAVIGFDDLPICEHLTPPLTTVRSPIVDAGRHGTELLVKLIETGSAESIILPTQLVTRQSSCI